MPDPTDIPNKPIRTFLIGSGLFSAESELRFKRLTGGVASDIWLVSAEGRSVCVKRALPKLRVAADWFAPVERNTNEAAWLRTAHGISPSIAPKVLAEDSSEGVFAMEYCPPDQYSNWKTRLFDGPFEVDTATMVGERLSLIHAETAARPELGATFNSDTIFVAIRLEPYLLATAKAHPNLAAQLEGLVERTLANKKALVHGDVSPKNILLGPDGPLFLDAECAWWGDPAFDVAFCLNHLLLKCLWKPSLAAEYLTAFDRLSAAYLTGVQWEDRDAFEARAASLLPALLLARVDGKSPVEYLTEESQKMAVRRTTTALLTTRVTRLGQVSQAWRAEVSKRVA